MNKYLYYAMDAAGNVIELPIAVFGDELTPEDLDLNLRKIRITTGQMLPRPTHVSVVELRELATDKVEIEVSS